MGGQGGPGGGGTGVPSCQIADRGGGPADVDTVIWSSGDDVIGNMFGRCCRVFCVYY